MTGAMYNLKPDSIDVALGDEVSLDSDGGRVLKVALVKDVPAGARDRMEYIGRM